MNLESLTEELAFITPGSRGMAAALARWLKDEAERSVSRPGPALRPDDRARPAPTAGARVSADPAGSPAPWTTQANRGGSHS